MCGLFLAPAPKTAMVAARAYQKMRREDSEVRLSGVIASAVFRMVVPHRVIGSGCVGVATAASLVSHHHPRSYVQCRIN